VHFLRVPEVEPVADRRPRRAVPARHVLADSRTAAAAEPVEVAARVERAPRPVVVDELRDTINSSSSFLYTSKAPAPNWHEFVLR
jgi:hypothetical protein